MNPAKKKCYLYIPFFKNHSLDACASISKKFVHNSVSRGILDRNIIKFIKIKKILCNFKPLDKLSLDPFFIKIDTEGTEHLVLKGLIKTIKKHKPVLMIEKNNMNFSFIKKILSKLNYNIYSFKNNNLKKYQLNKKEHLNLICISKQSRKLIKIYY